MEIHIFGSVEIRFAVSLFLSIRLNGCSVLSICAARLASVLINKKMCTTSWSAQLIPFRKGSLIKVFILFHSIRFG